ncbi:IS66 family insertion sequence element accessory protein TnpA [Paenibacillus xylaniclasticus]|uniref:IS66 family insertion sequence element accessory protein TnpA n=1 Tax=Paenibacillus xylaniclasticus TaxID=588083 RepID=UPI00403B199C
MENNLQLLWTERIRAYQTSGQTMKAWSEENHVSIHQLKYWLYKAQRKERAVSNTAFRPTITNSKASRI